MSYLNGIDVLGAPQGQPPVRLITNQGAPHTSPRQPPANAGKAQVFAQRLQKAAAHAAQAASKLTKVHPKASQALQSTSKAATKHAANVLATTTTVHGVIIGSNVVVGDAADMTNNAATAGDIISQVQPLVNQLQSSNPDLAKQGQAIVDRCNAVINDINTRMQALAQLQAAAMQGRGSM